jgi:anti-sigma B factor antagonist
MKIKSKDVDGAVVLEISGEMYGGPDNVALVDALVELAEQKQMNAILDMAKVKWIASTGLGILVRAHAKYLAAGGTLRLCNLNERVLTLLQVTKMNSMFPVHESQDAAIAATKA